MDMRQLREDIYAWVFFFLHDRDFIEALRLKYRKEDIDKELAEITRMFEEYIKA
jgi:hypothetical protein